ncbi:hypothetical protein [Hyphococcus sp.]|uniref:hypothetical protein n=1 Tax=Hyphococcus sp. TaxID=2038636 RepID=UPI003CCBC7D5
MATNNLIWIGLFCCLIALGVQLFPEAAFNMGVDVGASWLIFGFGVFLILIAAFVAASGGGNNRR